MISVVVVDDQELVRTGLRALAERDGDIAVTGEAATGRTGLSRVRELHPDVVLMDIRMPEMDGLEATRRILADPGLREVRVLVLTTSTRTSTSSRPSGPGLPGICSRTSPPPTCAGRSAWWPPGRPCSLPR